MIGYGFRDEEVNRYIKEYFVSSGKTILVLGIKKPESLFFKGLDLSQVQFVEKSITEVSTEKLSQFLQKV